MNYILDGKTPVLEPDLYKWAAWYKDHDRIVKQTEIFGVTVSTVFLGIDHSFRPGDKPLLFETMIFGGTEDDFQERYSTWDEAEAGHKKTCKRVKKANKEKS